MFQRVTRGIQPVCVPRKYLQINLQPLVSGLASAKSYSLIHEFFRFSILLIQFISL